LGQPRAQATQIEKQRLLRRTRAAAHDRPVAKNVVLHGGAYPPCGVGREANFSIGLETRRRFQEPDVTFLYQVADRKPERAELPRHRDDESHVGSGDLMQSFLIALVPPANCKRVFLIAIEIGRFHRGTDQASFRRFFHRQALHCPAPTCFRSGSRCF
jgi:hypothetical protein